MNVIVGTLPFSFVNFANDDTLLLFQIFTGSVGEIIGRFLSGKTECVCNSFLCLTQSLWGLWRRVSPHEVTWRLTLRIRFRGWLLGRWCCYICIFCAACQNHRMTRCLVFCRMRARVRKCLDAEIEDHFACTAQNTSSKLICSSQRRWPRFTQAAFPPAFVEKSERMFSEKLAIEERRRNLCLKIFVGMPLVH